MRVDLASQVGLQAQTRDIQIQIISIALTQVPVATKVMVLHSAPVILSGMSVVAVRWPMAAAAVARKMPAVAEEATLHLVDKAAINSTVSLPRLCVNRSVVLAATP